MAVSQRARNADRKGMSKRVGLYLREVRAEMRKVAWPNRREILSYTGVVLFFLLVVGFFLGLIDVLLAELFQALGIL